MDNSIVNRYMKLIEPLAFNLKLELLSRLSRSLKSNLVKHPEDKEKLLDELAGSWSDVDDNLIKSIYDSRSSSDKEIDLDEWIAIY